MPIDLTTAKALYLVDLDNCIADDSRRIKAIKWKTDDMDERYRAYHQLAKFDKMHNKHIIENRNVFILTARPIKYLLPTLEWIKKQGVNFEYTVMMRPEGNLMHSVELKQMQLTRIITGFRVTASKIKHAYDDRQDVIDMYKSNGIPATRTWIHDICAYTKP